MAHADAVLAFQNALGLDGVHPLPLHAIAVVGVYRVHPMPSFALFVRLPGDFTPPRPAGLIASPETSPVQTTWPDAPTSARYRAALFSNSHSSLFRSVISRQEQKCRPGRCRDEELHSRSTSRPSTAWRGNSTGVEGGAFKRANASTVSANRSGGMKSRNWVPIRRSRGAPRMRQKLSLTSRTCHRHRRSECRRGWSRIAPDNALRLRRAYPHRFLDGWIDGLGWLGHYSMIKNELTGEWRTRSVVV